MAKDVLGLAQLSKASQAGVRSLSGAFRSMTDAFREVQRKISDKGGKFVTLFNSIRAELDKVQEGSGAGFGVADFARLFDPTVPTHADRDAQGEDGYKAHNAFQTMNYMIRTQRAKANPRGRQGVRDLATAKLERALAMIVAIVTPDTEAILWEAVKSQFGLQERGITQLRNRTHATKPLLDMKALGFKPVALKPSVVVHMTPNAQQQVVAGMANLKAQIDKRGRRKVAA
jgi:hypothetical protein